MIYEQPFSKESTIVEKTVIKEGDYKEKNSKKLKIETFEVKECTFLLFGDEPLEQPEYNCYACDPEKNEKLCKDCFENCHKKCPRNPKSEPFQRVSNFICHCGSINCHYIAETKKNMKK